MFWRKTKAVPRQFPEKIEIFSRHCLVSSISQHKKRFPGYSRKICFDNFLQTLDRTQANITFILDSAQGNAEEHFLSSSQEKVIRIHEGGEAKAFLALLDIIASQPLHPDTIVYIVEDDYLHREGWMDILLEGFSLPHVDYVTLYDHQDKYFLPIYQGLRSQIFVTKSCHWRTIPSTTNTFAVRFDTLLEDLRIHRHFSKNRTISADHQKFCRLTNRGRVLVSPMPGFSTHAEPEFASPCIDWARFFPIRVH